MEIAIKKFRDGGVIVSLSGDISGLQDADRMSREVTEVISGPIAYLIFDFANASLMNSRFLGKMMELFKLNKSRGVRTFIFCGGNNKLEDLFKVAYIDHIIPIIANLKDAASFSSKMNDPPYASAPL
jgi:anti-anti-sigma regulatory factor